MIEIIVVVIVLCIMACLAFVSYLNYVNKAKSAEASTHIGVIQRAEQVRKDITDEYVEAKDTEGINDVLGLDLRPKYYDFQVVGVTEDDFIVLAKLIGEKLESLSGGVMPR
ncbi:MAG: hypothetical protein HQL21_01470, partial [Candidatus Omnitrophica bacterium]|nr:hypothetical protein [Candidatus Omnitrophota bacterium]